MNARLRVPLRLAGALALTVILGSSELLARDQGGPPDRLIGYFISWGIYGRNFVVKNLKDSGAAAKVTHVNYAFAGIGPDLRCQIADGWAEYDKPFEAAQSVDGVGEMYSSFELRGNFNQLRKLKLLYPDLKVLISLGGFTLSDRFSDAALTPESRQTLVSSCVDMFLRGHVAPGKEAEGLFDGIDVDWEFPGACGATCNFRPEDTQNYTALLAEFRSQLDALGASTGRSYLLTAASPAGPFFFGKIQLDRIHTSLDWINLLSFDFHGTWESATNFNSPLLSSPFDPSGPMLNADFAVRSYLAAGVPSEKLVLGVPFYGRGWSGVPNVNGGLYQPSTGAAPGTFEAGVEDYKVLKDLVRQGGPFRFRRDPATRATWLFNPAAGIFWSWDPPESMAVKARYVRQNRLGGVFFWEFTGDDAEVSLLSALDGQLHLR